MRINKMLAILLSLVLVCACAAVTAEETADESICTYVIYNGTGEKVTELYLTDNNTGEQSENYAGEEELADLGIVEIQGENYEGYVKTLSFKTESGYEAAFSTLHFENVPISLLPQTNEEADIITGPTPINFFVPLYTAHYFLCNQTGEKITKVTFTNNETGEIQTAWDDFDGIDALEDGAIFPAIYNCDADKTGELVLTLKFVTESGYEAEFTTLHFENVQINLLAPDAMTGATPISFGKAPEAE